MATTATEVQSVAYVNSSCVSDNDEKQDCKIRETVLEVKRNKLAYFWSLYGGIVMSLSSSVFFSLSFLIIKMLEKHGIGPFGAALLFNIGCIIPCSVIIIFNEFGPGWKTRNRVLKGIWPIGKDSYLKFMLMQGVLQAASVVLRSLSLKHLTVGDMTVIVFSSPIVTTILAHFIVGEKIGYIFIILAVFTLCGVGLITKPPMFTGGSFDTSILIGSALALGAMLTLSMKFVITRKIKKAHFLSMTFFLGWSGVFVTLPLFFGFGEKLESLVPTTTNGLLLRLGLISAFGAVGSINVALKMENAGVVSLVRSCDVIFAFALQYAFLGLYPDMLSAIGATMVWTGVLVGGVRKYLEDKRSSNPEENKVAESNETTTL